MKSTATEEECTPNTTVLNLTDDESLYTTIYLPVEWYIYMILYPCFLIFGITTNLSFLFVVIRVPYMHNITNFYLCNLAIADLLYEGGSVISCNHHFSLHMGAFIQTWQCLHQV